jgi:hypothetical protein
MKTTMKPAIVLAALLLAGCAEFASDAKRVTYDDGVKYIDENHEVRRAYRAQKEELLAEILDLYVDCMRGNCDEAQVEAAEGWMQKGLALLAENYRELATIEAMRAGIEDFGEFKRLINEVREGE